MHAEAVLSASPGNSEALRLVLRTLREEGRLEEAWAFVDRLNIEPAAEAPDLLIELGELANDSGNMDGVRRWCTRVLERTPDHPRGLHLMHRAAVKSFPLAELRAEVADWLSRDATRRETASRAALHIAFHEDQDWAGVVSLCDNASRRQLEWQIHKVLALARGGDVAAAESALSRLHHAHSGEDEVDLLEAELACEQARVPRQRAAINRVLARHGLAGLAETVDRFDVAHLACVPVPVAEEGPLVTVVMTVYGNGPWLDAAVRSVLEQSYRRIEVILVDDCSPDDALAALRGYERADPRVRVLQTPVNGGTYLAKNLALTRASGELITFMDSDDWAHPQRIERQVAALSSDPRAVGVWHNALRVGDGGHIELLGRASRPVYISLMLRRQVHERLGFFDGVRVGADAEFLARIRSAYGRTALLHQPLPTTFATRHTASLTGGGTHSLDWRSPTGDRLAYRCAFRAWHRRMAAKGRDPYVPHPLTERPFPAPEAMLAKARPSPART